MGKNYSEANYKKTYESEYVKSYEDRREAKKLYEERVRSYKEATQNVKAYNKKEKGKYVSQGSDSSTVVVRPEGNKSPMKRVTPTRQPKPDRESARSPVKETLPPVQEVKVETIEPTVTTFPKTEVPPPYNLEKEQAEAETKKPKKQLPRDYESYRKMVVQPVMPMGDGTYREMHRKEIVNEREARKILSYADYKPKALMNSVTFIIIAGVAGLLMSFFGSLCIIAWGYIVKKKSTTTYEKKFPVGRLTISLPATEQEKASYEKKAQMYIYVGVAIGAIQLVRLFI